MLTLVKKKDITPTESDSTYHTQRQLAKQSEETLQAQILDLDLVRKHYLGQASIPAKTLTHLMERLFKTVNQENALKTIQLVLQLLSIAHDQSQFRHHLRHTHRLEVKLVLLLLWNQRNHPQTSYLLGLMLDCYALAVSMQCRDVLALWKQHVIESRIQQQRKQQLLLMLSQKRVEEKQQKNRGGFERVTIPL